MFRLVYISSETEDSTPGDLEALLIQSRDKNIRLGITGLLLHRPGHFLQVLEGREEDVRALMDSIVKDKRHHRVITVLKEETASRDFPDWSMAFRQVDTAAGIPEGFSDALIRPPGEADLGRYTEKVRLFIELFKMAATEENADSAQRKVGPELSPFTPANTLAVQ